MDLEVDVTDPAAVARLRGRVPARGRLPPGRLDRRGRRRGRARTTRAAVNGDRAGQRRRRRRRGRARRWCCPPPTTSSTGRRGAPTPRTTRRRRSARTGAPSSRGSGRPWPRHPDGARIARTAWLYGAAGATSWTPCARLGAERDEVDRGRRPGGLAHLDARPRAGPRGPARARRRASTTPPAAASVTWAGFAEADLRGAPASRCRVRPITTAELGRPAPRPARLGPGGTRPGAPGLRTGARRLRTTSRRRREAPRHRRLRVHRLGVRAPGAGARRRGR